MKKYLASILSLLLALVMVVSLIGCEIEHEGDEENESSKSSSSQSESSDDSSSLVEPAADGVTKEDDVDNIVPKDDNSSSTGKDKTSSKVESSSKIENEKTSSKEDTVSIKENEKVNLAGNWIANVDITELVLQEFTVDSESEAMLEYIEFSPMELQIHLELTSSGKAKMYINEDQFVDLIDVIINDIIDGAILMIKEECESIYGMSYDELLAESGMTESEFEEFFYAVMVESYDIESLLEELDELETQGTYTFKNNEIELVSDDGEVVFAKYKNGKLYMEEDGVPVIFEKQ